MRAMRVGIGVGAAAVAAAGAAYALHGSAGASAPAPCDPPGCVLHVAPSGDDAAACTDDAPCLTFDRAYHAAQPGQAVEAAAGSYGEQKLLYDPAKTSPDDVVFRPAAGAKVDVAGVTVGPDRY